jgi:hypothetical protein
LQLWERIGKTCRRSEYREQPEGIPGVESAKSIFFGVEVGEGVADNRPVLPPSEPSRKSSQSKDPDDPQGRGAPLEEVKIRRKI